MPLGESWVATVTAAAVAHLRRRRGAAVTDLATDYLGLRLRNPLVAAASPLSQTVDGVRALADAGIGAVVVYSLFEERLQDPARPR